KRLNILERKKQVGAQFIDDRDTNSKKQRIREILRRRQTETVRKMFIGMADDPRVVLLKLAYRLHAMRLLSEQQRQEKESSSSPAFDRQEMLTMAQETHEIYAPLAGRLGMSRVESELEDLAFEILEPEKYEWVRSHVEMG